MKSFVAVILSCLLLQCYARPQGVALPQKCEDVLSAEQCQQLRDAASKLHEKASDVLDAIQEAAKNHVTNAKDVLKFVQEKLVAKAVNFKCEDALSAETCQKIRDFAKNFHLNAKEVAHAIKEAIVEGAKDPQAVLQKAKDFLIEQLTCENVLGKERCDQLTDAASKLHEKASAVTDAVREAVKKHYTKAQEVLDYVRETLVQKATNFKCEDALGAETCAKLVDLAKRFHVKVEEVNIAVKEAIVKGALNVKEQFNVAAAFLKNLSNAKCEDLIDAATCQKIRDFANKVHLNTKEVIEAVKEAILEGARDPQAVLKKAIDFLKAQLSCENVIGKERCDQLRSLADKVGVSLSKLDEVMREAIANGVTSAKDLYKTVIDWIMDKWGDFLGRLTGKREAYASIDDIIEKIKEKLRKALLKAVDKILDTFNVVDEKIREKVKELIEKGGVKITEVKERVIEILENLGVSVAADEAEFASLYEDIVLDEYIEEVTKIAA